MYREGLLILSIILIIVGAVIGFIPYVPDVLASVIFWVGIILFIIWIILFAIVTIKSGA
jgi:quinol-cytochrome oxidoreductase complex cytochrome b subunit